jgi:beta-galactosidase
MNEWRVPYAPGRLEAVGKTGGKVVAHAVVETTGAPVALRLTPDRGTLAGDGRDAVPVTVEALDAKGRPAPTANLPVTFEVTGGRIIGLGNGDANCHEPEKGDARSLYNGLAQVIVQTDPGAAGELVLRAASPGLKPAQTRLAVRPDRGPPRVT